jgi:hypothetical protein
MAIEEELLQEMVRVFAQLRRMVQRFQGAANLSRGRQERMLREAIRDWLREDPRANALRERMEDGEFERRVAAEADRVIEERLEPQNDPGERYRNPADEAQQRREQEEHVRDDEDRNGNGVDDAVEQRDQAQEDLDRRNDRDRDGVDDAVERREQDREEQDRAENRKREEEQQVEESSDNVRLDLAPVAVGAAAEAVVDEERAAEEAAARETEAVAQETAQRGDAEPGIDPLNADVDSDERAEAVEATAEADGQTPQTRDQEALATAEVDDRPADERDDRLLDEPDERAEEARPADAEIEDQESAQEHAAQRPVDEQREREEIAETDEGVDDRASESQTGADEDLDRDGPQDSRQVGVDRDDELDDRAGGDEATVHEPEPGLPTAGDRAEANKVENSQDAPDQAEQVTTDSQVSNDQTGAALPDDALKAQALNHGGQRPASEAATAPGEVPTATPHAGVTAGRQHRLQRQGTKQEQEYTGPERIIGD